MAIKHKLDIINEYGVAGAGSWALGQEDPGVLDFYDKALTRTTKLTPKPESKSKSAPNSEPILPGKKPKPDRPSNQNKSKLINVLNKN